MRDTGACVKGVFDPLADGVFLAVGAVDVHVVQDAGAVLGRAATSAGVPLAFSHSDRAAWRRSYGRRASAVAARCGPSAAWRAACQARP